MIFTARDQSVEATRRVEHLLRVWTKRRPMKYDRDLPADPTKRIAATRVVVQRTPEERRERKRLQDRQSKDRAHARPPQVVAVAVWLGANTALRLAREWSTAVHIARRSLEAAERAGVIARIGKGTWVAGDPT